MSETGESWKEELLYSGTRSTAALVQVISALINDIALLDKRLMKLEERVDWWGLEMRLQRAEARLEVLEGRRLVPPGSAFLPLTEKHPHCAHEFRFDDVNGLRCTKCGDWIERLAPGVAIYGDGPSATPPDEHTKDKS